MPFRAFWRREPSFWPTMTATIPLSSSSPRLVVYSVVLLSLIANFLPVSAQPLAISPSLCLDSSRSADPGDVFNVHSIFAQVQQDHLRLVSLAEVGQQSSGYSDDTGFLSTVIVDSGILNINSFDNRSSLCDHIQGDCPYGPGYVAYSVDIPFHTPPRLADIDTQIELLDYSSPSRQLSCVDISVTPYQPDNIEFRLFQWFPIAIALCLLVLHVIARIVAARQLRLADADTLLAADQHRPSDPASSFRALLFDAFAGIPLLRSPAVAHFCMPSPIDPILAVQRAASLAMIPLSWPGFAYTVLAAPLAWSCLIGTPPSFLGYTSINPFHPQLETSISPENGPLSDQISDSNTSIFLDQNLQNTILLDRNSTNLGLPRWSMVSGIRDSHLFSMSIVLFLIILAVVLLLSLVAFLIDFALLLFFYFRHPELVWQVTAARRYQQEYNQVTDTNNNNNNNNNTINGDNTNKANNINNNNQLPSTTNDLGNNNNNDREYEDDSNEDDSDDDEAFGEFYDEYNNNNNQKHTKKATIFGWQISKNTQPEKTKRKKKNGNKKRSKKKSSKTSTADSSANTFSTANSTTKFFFNPTTSSSAASSSYKHPSASSSLSPWLSALYDLSCVHFFATIGNCVRILKIFHFPLAIFSTYNLTLSDQSTASKVQAVIVLAFLCAIIPAILVWRLAAAHPDHLWIDDDRPPTYTSLALGPLYTTLSPRAATITVSLTFLHSLASAIIIGAVQPLPTLQAALLLAFEVIDSLTTTVWLPWYRKAPMGAHSFSQAVLRLLTSLLALVLAPDLKIGYVAAGWVTYVLLGFQAFIMLAFLIVTIMRFLELVVRVAAHTPFDESSHSRALGLSGAIRRRNRRSVRKTGTSLVGTNVMAPIDTESSSYAMIAGAGAGKKKHRTGRKRNGSFSSSDMLSSYGTPGGTVTPTTGKSFEAGPGAGNSRQPRSSVGSYSDLLSTASPVSTTTMSMYGNRTHSPGPNMYWDMSQQQRNHPSMQASDVTRSNADDGYIMSAWQYPYVPPVPTPPNQPYVTTAAQQQQQHQMQYPHIVPDPTIATTVPAPITVTSSSSSIALQSTASASNLYLPSTAPPPPPPPPPPPGAAVATGSNEHVNKAAVSTPATTTATAMTTAVTAPETKATQPTPPKPNPEPEPEKKKSGFSVVRGGKATGKKPYSILNNAQPGRSQDVQYQPPTNQQDQEQPKQQSQQHQNNNNTRHKRPKSQTAIVELDYASSMAKERLSSIADNTDEDKSLRHSRSQSDIELRANTGIRPSLSNAEPLESSTSQPSGSGWLSTLVGNGKQESEPKKQKGLFSAFGKGKGKEPEKGNQADSNKDAEGQGGSSFVVVRKPRPGRPAQHRPSQSADELTKPASSDQQSQNLPIQHGFNNTQQEEVLSSPRDTETKMDAPDESDLLPNRNESPLPPGARYAQRNPTLRSHTASVHDEWDHDIMPPHPQQQDKEQQKESDQTPPTLPDLKFD